MLLYLLLTLPWLALAVYLVAVVRLPRPLPRNGAAGPDAPRVSVIVPARNEAHNIGRVLDSLGASAYPDFEIVVVDDRSTDATASLARARPPGRARRIRVVEGSPLPPGWLGKPWACRQGADHATGEVLLFTDADTVHGPDLLGRAVAALAHADAVTVVGRQIMESFWERLVQPHVFLSMLLRFHDLARPLPPGRWRDAIANGQYILLTRSLYDRLGGHDAVKGDVVEDLRLAQVMVRNGHTLDVRRAEDALGTRMYRSLGELVRGWSKNVVLGGRQTLPRPLRPFMAPGMVLSGVGLWMVPPGVLVAALAGVGGTGLVVWAAGVVAASAAFWTWVGRRFGVPAAYGPLYPLGAAVTAWIVVRSWMGMERVEWKGRRYRVDVPPG